MIHIRYLTRHTTTDRFSSREVVPPPETVTDDGTIEFEVESILSHRVRKYGRGSRLEYLIHWKGYQSHDDTWEPLGTLKIVRNLSQNMITNSEMTTPKSIHWATYLLLTIQINRVWAL